MHKVGSKGNIGIFCIRLYSCLRGKKIKATNARSRFEM